VIWKQILNPRTLKFVKGPVLEYMDEELQYAFQVSKSLIESIQHSESSGEDSDEYSTIVYKHSPSTSGARLEGSNRRFLVLFIS